MVWCWSIRKSKDELWMSYDLWILVGILNIKLLWASGMFSRVVIPPDSWKVKGKRLNRFKSSYLDLQWVQIDSKGFLLHTISEETNHHWLLVLVKRSSMRRKMCSFFDGYPVWIPHHSPPNHEMFATIRWLISIRPTQKIPTPSNIPRLNLHTSYHLGFLPNLLRKWSTRWAWVVGLCGNPLFSSLMGDGDFIHSPNWTPGYAAGEQWLQSRAYAEGHEGLRSDGLRAGPLLLDRVCVMINQSIKNIKNSLAVW